MYLAFLNILINGKFHKGVQAGGSLCELKTKQISEAVHEYFIFWGKNAFRHCVKNTSGTMRNISYQLCWWEEWLTIIYNIFGTTWLLISQLLLELVSVINQQQTDVGSLTTSSLLPSRLGRLCIPLPNKLQTYGVSPSSLCVFVTVGVQAAGFLVQLQPDLCSYSWQ